jgi:predicted nucleic acid-binding protein
MKPRCGLALCVMLAMAEFIFTYTDKSFSYTDATTFAVMERLGINEALAFDQHFPQYGFLPYGNSA